MLLILSAVTSLLAQKPTNNLQSKSKVGDVSKDRSYTKPLSIAADHEGVSNAISSGSNSKAVELMQSDSGLLITPEYFFAEVIDTNNALLQWGDVTGNQGTWLSYCSDEYFQSLGLGTGEAATFEIAIGWPAGSLSNLDGQSLVNVAFYPTSQLTSFSLKVYSGANLNTLIYSQPILSYSPNQWNVVALNTPILLDNSTDFFVAVEVHQAVNEYPVAIDNQTAVAGYSDLVNISGEWHSLYDFGFNNNWLLKVFVADIENTITALPMPLAGNKNLNEGTTLKAHSFLGLDAGFPASPQKNSLSEFVGYKLFRNGSLIQELAENTFFDAGLDLGTYTYGLTAVYAEGESQMVSRTVQIGTPALNINPSMITDSIEAGLETKTYSIVFSNSGNIAVEWDIPNLPLGISFDNSNGTIAPGASQTVSMTFDATAMFPGQRNYNISIATNNFNQPVTNLLVNMTVTGESGLIFSENTIDFGIVDINQQQTKTIQVVNNSAISAFVSVQTSSPNFQPYIDSYHLIPGDSAHITISFVGSELGAYTSEFLVKGVFNSDESTYSIPLEAFVALPAPTALLANLVGDTVNLNWYPPGVNPSYLQYGNGALQAGVGGIEDFEVAAKFEADLLQYYAGKTLTHIGFFVWENNPLFEIKVYRGDGAGTLALQQTVATVKAMEWNDIELETPIAIDSQETLWLGYAVTGESGYIPAGVDFGPAINGKSDLVRLAGSDTWLTLSEYGLPYNWNIRGWANSGNNIVPLSYQQPHLPSPTPLNATGGLHQKGPFSFTENQRSSNTSFLGYNIYRNGEALNSSPTTNTNWMDLLQAPGSFLYEVTSVFDLGESLPASVFISNDTTTNMPEGWNFEKTSFVHNIYIPVEAALRGGLRMEAGDMMGVFFHKNGIAYCAGAVAYQNGQLMMTAYGDNPTTPEKEGFAFGETIYWKVYLQNQKMAYDLNVTYDKAMPQHNGQFHISGLSMLASMETVTLNINEEIAQNYRVYPNPNAGNFILDGLRTGDQISILDATGRLIQRFEATGNSIKKSVDAKGFLIIEFKRGEQITYQKILIQ